MSGNDYAALIAATQASLNTRDYGRNGNHAMGACPKCKIHVCLTHHTCPKR